MNRHLASALCVFCLTGLAFCQRTDAYVPVPKFSWPQHVVGIENYLVFKGRAFAVGAPILVSGPSASKASWSPDGQFLVFEESRAESNVATLQTAILSDKPLQPDVFLDVYSISDGKSSDILRLDPDAKDIDIEWMPGTENALVAVNKVSATDDPAKAIQTGQLYILDAASSSAKEFSPWSSRSGPQAVEVSVSPSQGYAFLTATFKQPDRGPSPEADDGTTSEVVLMTADELHVQVKAPDGYLPPLAVWSEDGTSAFALARNPSKPAGARTAWFKVSLLNGNLTPTDRPASFYMGAEKAGVITVREIQQSSTNEKVTKTINNIWLETLDPDSQNRMLLAGDATEGSVSKNLMAASYIAQGSLYVRPITEVPKARFDQELAEWERTKALDRARQAGTAFLMFAADNDDTLPANKDKWSEMLSPYIANSSGFDGFVYSYAGGPMADVRNPAYTQLGYVDVNGGRAVVYVDGHVNWVPNP